MLISIFYAAWIVAASLSGSDVVHERSEQSIQDRMCEWLWSRQPDCQGDEPNPFSENGFAHRLYHEVPLGDAVARVRATSFREFYNTTSSEPSGGGDVHFEFSCRYPTGWSVDLARTEIKFNPMLAHMEDDTGEGLYARCGIVTSGRVFDNQQVNTSVYWIVEPKGITEGDFLAIRAQLNLPDSHAIEAGERLSEEPMNRGAALAFSSQSDAREARYWSVYPYEHRLSPIPSEPGMRFIPDSPYPAAFSVKQLVASSGAADLQGQISWDATRASALCSSLGISERHDCSWRLPASVADLLATSESSGENVFGHLVWYLNDKTLVLTTVDVGLKSGSVTPIRSEILASPQDLGLPSIRSMGRLRWP